VNDAQQRVFKAATLQPAQFVSVLMCHHPPVSAACSNVAQLFLAKFWQTSTTVLVVCIAEKRRSRLQ